MKGIVHPGVSVIIPVLNGEVPLQKLLYSLKAQDYPWKKLEIIVVDDDSTDGTVKLAKAFGARVLKNGAHHIEKGKAIGTRAAKNELLLFIDADNYLVDPKWLSTAVEALQKDKGLVGAQSSRFHYAAGDPAANRYCSLMGINDPMAFFLNKRDRLTDWESDWGLLGEVEADRGDYWILGFEPRAIPTIGSQGYLTRKSLVKKASHWPYYFHMDANVELIEQGFNRFALLKAAVGHDHCATTKSFVAKCKRNLHLFFKYRHLRKYTWETPRLEFLWTVISMVTVIRPMFHALKGFSKRPDPAWFLHPYFSFVIPVMYTWQTLFARPSQADTGKS